MTISPSSTLNSEAPNGRVMVVRESVEAGAKPRELHFASFVFEPLGYELLAGAKLDQPMVVPLTGRGTIVGGDVEPTQIGKVGSFRFDLESRFASKSVGLVRGGWLPSAMALEDESIVLPDRCVVAELDRRLKDGETKSAARGDFIDLFADQPIRINPALFALEGDEKEQPTAASARASLDEAIRKLRASLPKAVLIAADASGLKGIVGLVEDTREGMDRKRAFLIGLNPRLQSPIASRRASEVCNEIIAAARACGLGARSLVVVAALSAALVPNGRSPAKRLLKFRPRYGDKDAYNALADLRSLEVLIGIFALWPEQRVMLCTADKDLALFWTGLRASRFAYCSSRASYELAPEFLVPGITDEQWSTWLA